MGRPTTWSRGALVAAATVALAGAALRRRPPGGTERWTRTNHAGEPVSLLEGTAVAVGLLAGQAAGGGARRPRASAIVATAGAAAFGTVDDLAEDRGVRTKGLRGHLTALRRGTVTTGALKVVGIGSSALAGAVVRRTGSGARWPAVVGDVAIDTVLVAGSANLVNLLDLRPGRALKAAALSGVLLSGAPVSVAAAGTAGATIGASVAAARDDLAGRSMLGDGGANALGAACGSAVAAGCPRPVRAAAAVGVVALVLLSERVSFSAVIARNPVLDRIDRWGRGRTPGAA